READGSREIQVWHLVVTAQTAAVLIGTLALSLRGFRFGQTGEQNDGRAARHRQFSLGQLLLWTTIVAPLVPLSRSVYNAVALWRIQTTWIKPSEWQQIAVYGVLLAATSLGAV